MKYSPCPRCKSSKILRDKKKLGYTECLNCDLKLPSVAWDGLVCKVNTLQRGDVIELTQPAIDDDEKFIIEQRRDELWSRLSRVMPDDSGFYASGEVDLTGRINEIRLIILNYISELTHRKEIPYGLTIRKIFPNAEKAGHLIVEFGYSADCPRQNKAALLPYISCRYSLL